MRILNPDDTIEEDEPVVIFKGKSRLSHHIVKQYSLMLINLGLPKLATKYYQMGCEMETWRMARRKENINDKT